MAHTTNRPGVVVAAAILLFIAGGFSVLGVFCAGIGLAAQSAMPENPALKGKPALDARALQKRMNDEIPGKQFVDYGNLGFNFLFGIVKIIVGVGLLKMMSWARMTAFVVAVISILFMLGHAAYQAIVEFPVNDRIFADQAKELPPNMPFNFPMFMQSIAIVVLVLAVVIVLAYWLTVIFLLSGERVRMAFANAGTDPPPTDEEKPRSRYEGYDDEGDRPPETGIKE
jgi:hypothetical protein